VTDFKLTSNRFRAPWSLFWVGLTLRVLVILIGHTYRIRVPMDHFGFGWEMGRIARSLYLGQGYANPFNGPSGPTAWAPPLYPLLMALSFKLFGLYTNAAALFLLICNSVLSAAIAPAVYEIAARCFDSQSIARRSGSFFRRPAAHPVALWSGWLWAVYPAALQYAIHWIWEMSLSTFLFTWIIVLTLRLRHTGEPTQSSTPPQTLRWITFGALWGLLMLSNASLLLCLPAMLLWIATPTIRRQSINRALLLTTIRGAVLAGIAMALVMAPWIIRNERVLHALVPARSNLPIEIYQSTLFENDGFPWGTTLPLWSGDPEFQRYVRLGEIQYAKVRGAEATARIKAMPAQIIRWDIDRFLFFWDGTPHPMDKHPAQEYGRELSYSFLSLCGLLGLGLMLHRRIVGAGLIGLIFLLMPIPYYLLTVQARFRHPIEPLIAVLAVYLFRSTEPKHANASQEPA
jgi:hypothetical protein